MPQQSAANPIGLPFIELQSVDSTNNYARQQISAVSLPERQCLPLHGLTVFTHEQLAGKGQRSRVWSSEKGANIAMSIVIKPIALKLTQQFQLSACAAVAVHEFFRNYAGDNTKIKWPNDLYWQDRKAGGILIENTVGSTASGAGNWDWAIIGIGININQVVFPSFLPNPVSLKQICGKNFKPVELAKEVCFSLDKYFQLLTTEGFEEIYSAYISNLYKRNKKAKLKKGSRVFEAVVKTVTPSGRLLVQHAIEEEFDFGEVEWVV